MKKLFLIFILSLLVVSLVLSGCISQPAAPASAQPEKQVIKLGFATKWPEANPIWQWTYKPAIQEIESRSEGRIKFDLYLNAVLGNPDNHYDFARTGKVDIAEFSPGYNPGQFPMSDLLGLPLCWDHTNNSAKAAQALVDRLLFQEYTDTHLLELHRTEHFYLIGNKNVKTMDDLKGLKVRNPSPIVGLCLAALGAEPINMAVTELYLALQTGVLDGAVAGSTIMPSYKINEVVKYLLDFNMGTTATGLAMNKDSWNKVPEDLKPIITEAFAKDGYRHAQYAAAAIPDCWGLLKKSAGPGAIIKLSAEEEAKWTTVIGTVVTKWAQGLPDKKALDIAREEAKKLGVKFAW